MSEPKVIRSFRVEWTEDAKVNFYMSLPKSDLDNALKGPLMDIIARATEFAKASEAAAEGFPWGEAH